VSLFFGYRLLLPECVGPEQNFKHIRSSLQWSGMVFVMWIHMNVNIKRRKI